MDQEKNVNGAYRLSLIHKMCIRDSFIAIRDLAGVPCRLHDLRHAVATHLLSSGVDVTTTARRMGFTPSVMLQTYAHALEDADREAAAVMGGLLDAKN